MYTIKTLNASQPGGLAKLPKNQFDVTVDADARTVFWCAAPTF